jgi:hypothetical protein
MPATIQRLRGASLTCPAVAASTSSDASRYWWLSRTDGTAAIAGDDIEVKDL